VERAQSLPTIRSLDDILAGPLEQGAHEGSDVPLVIDDEDPLPVHTAFIPHPVEAQPPRSDRCRVARVLIVDPDREITHLFAHAVERLGHTAVQWNEEMSTDVEADVVLVEPARPRALAFARVLREARPGIAIVVVSIRARGGADLELGAVAHLDKPFERRELERALTAALAA
jgi:CheY-like chemotaxis protein